VRVVVAAIRLTTTSWLARVWPRQFDEMWENSRCSIWGEMHPPDPDAVRVLGIDFRQFVGDVEWRACAESSSG
jgi:hypothetical protein